MNLPCEMVQDLLPLYHDGVCSEVSKSMVKEHLDGCANCRQVLNKIDAEIAVPELEVGKAQPLVSIHVQWNKQTRKMLLKCIAAGIGSFVLLIAAWFVTTQWSFIPVEKEDYIVRRTAQLADGRIYLEFSNHYVHATPDSTITEDGRLYENQKRTLLFAEREEDRGGYASITIDPETDTWPNADGERIRITAFYLGEPDSEDAILLWRAGMELPPASAELEEEIKERDRIGREAAVSGKGG